MIKLVNLLIKYFWAIVGLIIFLIPFWLWLLIRYLLSPEGFWQNLFFTCVGVYFLGFIQVILLIIYVLVLLVTWPEYD